MARVRTLWSASAMVSHVATWDDVHRLALALPQTGEGSSRDGLLAWSVKDRTFAWERPLLRMSERHEVVAIRLLDTREYELPDAGLIVVQDAETGEQLVVDSSDDEFRHRLRTAGEQREAELRAATLRAGVDICEVSTADDLVTAIVSIVESRKRRRA